MSFDNLIGNEKIKNNLEKTLDNHTITHSYMFIGNSGIGKKEFAKEFAKGILCQNAKKTSCNICKSCIEFVNGNNPDYYEINLTEDENSIKIDTHKDNISMQKLLEKNDFKYCGIIYLEDGSQRIAFEKII